ncbi:MAG: hypothetical protein AAF226_07325 [Verrucomicrobiota bacterium]
MRDDSLTLKNYAGQIDLKSKLERFVLQRKTSKAFTITTKIEFEPTAFEFAGLILNADKENYIQAGVIEQDGELQIVQRIKAGAFHPLAHLRAIPGVEKIMKSTRFKGKKLYLRIEVKDPETAYFSYSTDNENWRELGWRFFGRGVTPDLGW